MLGVIRLIGQDKEFSAINSNFSYIGVNFMSNNKRSIPMTHLILAMSGYRPLSGSKTNEHGLHYLMRHESTGRIICLNGDNRTYRPMGKLVRVDLS